MESRKSIFISLVSIATNVKVNLLHVIRNSIHLFSSYRLQCLLCNLKSFVLEIIKFETYVKLSYNKKTADCMYMYIKNYLCKTY